VTKKKSEIRYKPHNCKRCQEIRCRFRNQPFCLVLILNKAPRQTKYVLWHTEGVTRFAHRIYKEVSIPHYVYVSQRRIYLALLCPKRNEKPSFITPLRHEICSQLGFYAACNGNSLPTPDLAERRSHLHRGGSLKSRPLDARCEIDNS